MATLNYKLSHVGDKLLENGKKWLFKRKLIKKDSVCTWRKRDIVHMAMERDSGALSNVLSLPSSLLPLSPPPAPLLFHCC